MSDRLGEFLTKLADNHGADVVKQYKHGRADVNLDSFKPDLNRIYRYEAAGLLYTGRKSTASYLPHNPTKMIEVALTPEGVERWRST